MSIRARRDPFEASLSDDKVETLIAETLRLMEYRFALFDTDGLK